MRPHARAGRPEAEDDPDLALAKMLQAQEQAWLAMGGGLENMPSPGASPAGGAGGAASGAGGQAGAEEEDEGELDDAELARRFQEQEEREFQARLLALAGVGPAGGGGGGDGGSEGYGSEAGEEEGEEHDVDPDDMSYEELTALGEVVGTVSKGLAAADIDALPQQHYYEVAGTTAGVEEQCPICRMEFEPEDAVKVLPLCSHYYHPPCVGEWLRRNKVCCICNKEVLEEGAASKEAAAAGGASSGAAASGVLGERRQ